MLAIGVKVDALRIRASNRFCEGVYRLQKMPGIHSQKDYNISPFIVHCNPLHSLFSKLKTPLTIGANVIGECGLNARTSGGCLLRLGCTMSAKIQITTFRF